MLLISSMASSIRPFWMAARTCILWSIVDSSIDVFTPVSAANLSAASL
jgi:hypothetical protein